MAAVCIVVAVFFAIGSLLSSKIINASKYQKLLDVETRSFKDDIKEVSYDQIPILDKDSARQLVIVLWEQWLTLYRSLK